ncbi:unnamed protein product [Trifolium pratense]|uniref:Uncharacterized protein n=1 Tax=Trifolium pratense TaxID=57577 RepID=A0ACB0I850_TRIPR|nr:unnamed protein product [Trifolium pratense]
MGDVADKLAYFQAITGLEDPDLCTEILAAHGWDLELAISSFTTTTAATTTTDTNNNNHDDDVNLQSISESEPPLPPPPPGLAWKLIKLPISVISGSLGLVSGAIGLGLWAAGGVLSYSLGFVGLGSGSSSSSPSASSSPLVSVSAATTEAMQFVAAFERDYGTTTKPNFVSEGFMDALQRTLCSDVFVEFVNQNFVCWGGSIRASEGFKMSNSLKASRFPFCALVMAATNQRIALLQQVEGPKSPEEMLVVLQRVLEESSPVLVAARLDAEERRNNARLREEQDAAYRAALEADQARERQRREEEERFAREAAEAERKLKEEEEARERAAQEAAEKQAALAKLREEKAQSLGEEPEKGPNVTQVLVRFPNGVRKDRRFNSTVTIQSLYDYVDSLGLLEAENYSLVSNFPRVVYGQEKLTQSLKEAGLHPQASLFVELSS